MTRSSRVSSVRREWRGAPFPSSPTSIKASEQGMESTTTSLHEEKCPVDEYPASKEVMRAIQNTDPMWFGALTSGLQSVEQNRTPQEICVLTDQRKAAAESNRIEKSGGYVFQNRTVPPSFSSGGTPFR
ncbi:importin-7-like [Amblyomma americanum]